MSHPSNLLHDSRFQKHIFEFRSCISASLELYLCFFSGYIFHLSRGVSVSWIHLCVYGTIFVSLGCDFKFIETFTFSWDTISRYSAYLNMFLGWISETFRICLLCFCVYQEIWVFLGFVSKIVFLFLDCDFSFLERFLCFLVKSLYC